MIGQEFGVGGAVHRMGKMKIVYTILAGKP
jgi:hypothetical protein